MKRWRMSILGLMSHGKGEEARATPTRTDNILAFVAYSFLAVSFYALLNNNFFLFYSSLVNPALKWAGIPLSLDAYLALAVFLLVLVDVRSEMRLERVMVISWFLFLPSVIGLSRMDWLATVDWPLSLDLFASKLPFSAVALMGVALVGFDLLVRYHHHVKDVVRMLHERGAPTEDIKEVTRRNTLFLSRMALSSTLIALSVVAIAPIIELVAGPLLAGLPNFHHILSMAATLILGIMVLLYLRSRHARGESQAT